MLALQARGELFEDRGPRGPLVAVDDQKEDPRASDAPHDELEEVERCAVGPLNVVQHDDDGRLTAQVLQEPKDSFEETSLRRAAALGVLHLPAQPGS